MLAVHEEKREHEKRSKSFIVSGLNASKDLTDNDAVCKLCEDEFNITPSVVFCRRLGNEEFSSSRPILVALKSAEQVCEIVSSARSLRHSNDLYVSKNVYINANLTKVEAHAAYLERCRRRQEATKHSEKQATVQISTDNGTIAGDNQKTSMTARPGGYNTRFFTNSRRLRVDANHSTTAQGRQDNDCETTSTASPSMSGKAPEFYPDGRCQSDTHVQDPALTRTATTEQSGRQY
jgi:hypothetical protein